MVTNKGNVKVNWQTLIGIDQPGFIYLILGVAISIVLTHDLLVVRIIR